MSLKPVAKRLSALIGTEVIFIEDPISDKAREEIKKLKSGNIVLLENIQILS